MITSDTAAALSADFILNIKSYTQLFNPNLSETVRIYRKLSSKWHPDRKDGAEKTLAEQVFSHLSVLYAEAKQSIEADTWGGKGVIFALLSGTSELRVNFLKEELVPAFGTQYIGRDSVHYLVSSSEADLVEVWIKNIAKFKAGVKISSTLERVFAATTLAAPEVTKIKSGLLVKVPKNDKYLSLKHCLTAKPIEIRHVVWIISRLMNLACFMQTRDAPNLDICTRSVFINPETHDAFLADGWQYADSFRHKALAAPAKLLKLCPDLTVSKQVQPRHVIAQIKALGRECLGDPIGVNLQFRKDVPKPFGKWLISPGEDDCIKAFSIWDKVKVDSFGPPKFIDLHLTEKDVYHS